MTPEQVKLVQQSFAQVAPIADKAAEIFYGRLFEVAPSVKPLFHGDMAQQRRKLMARSPPWSTGSAICRACCRPRARWPSAMSATARSRTTIRWSARHCCGRWSAELGPQWTPEVAAAWTAAYTALSNFMIAEAYGPPQAAE